MIPLNAMTALWAVLPPLVDDVPDPEDVKPGWLGFAVFLLLAAALVVLAFSFRKQLRKVTFVEKEGDAAGSDDHREGRGDHSGDGDPGAPRTP